MASRRSRPFCAARLRPASIVARGYEIVHPLTEEPWGVRRFFVRAPDGNVINMVSHSDD